jgi:hypothetical protein
VRAGTRLSKVRAVSSDDRRGAKKVEGVKARLLRGAANAGHPGDRLRAYDELLGWGWQQPYRVVGRNVRNDRKRPGELRRGRILAHFVERLNRGVPGPRWMRVAIGRLASVAAGVVAAVAPQPRPAKTVAALPTARLGGKREEGD